MTTCDARVPYLLLQANGLHIPLRDKSVHTIITSPPYFGLRDYGTAQWTGGEAECDHTTAPSRGDDIKPGDKQGTSRGSRPHRQQICLCGAERIDAQLGLETLHDCVGWATGDDCGSCYLCHLRVVMAECWRVLRDDGTLWVVIADSYNANGRIGHGARVGYKQGTNRASATGQDAPRSTAPGLKPKDLCLIPQRLALALQSDGWTVRSEIIWQKPSAMPSSVEDRVTVAHEQVWLLTKRAQYFYDTDAVRQPYSASGVNDALHQYGYGRKINGKQQQLLANGTHGYGGVNDPARTRDAFYQHGGANLRSVWTLTSEPTPEAHFATMPRTLVRRCILAGTSAYGVCRACAAPYRRIVERQRLLDGHIPVTGSFSRPDEPFRAPANGKGHWRYSTRTTEHGWQPSCRCFFGPGYAPPVPATVLDPFVGSGTTVLEAVALGRRGIGLDLSAPYLHMIAAPRLVQATRQPSLFDQPGLLLEPSAAPVQASLFPGMAVQDQDISIT
jgi:DNA modification methylase